MARQRLEHGPTSLNPNVLHTVPWEQLRIPTNVIYLIKKTSDRAEIQPGRTASKPCCPNPTAVIYF